MSKTKSMIEVDLNDPRSSKIAEALSNKTSKKILNYLADKGEVSGSEIAEELGIPLNTVTYNMKKLVAAGLVDKSGRTFWSSRGKKMDLYTISNKKIIISPKRLTQSVVAGIVGVLAVVLIALVYFGSQAPSGEFRVDGRQEIIFGEGANSFESVDQLKRFLEDGDDGGFSAGNGAFFDEAASFDSAVASVESSGADGGSVAPRAASASEYSGTNIQVGGVDEADIVKNDGNYIYTVSGNTVLIVGAYPAEEMEILSELAFEKEYVSNLFLNKETLVVFTQRSEYIDSGIACGSAIYGIRCGGYSRARTGVYVYNVQDRENPVLENYYEFDGNYRESRMVDDVVYLVSTKHIQRNWFSLPGYSLNGEEHSFAAREIQYFDDSSRNSVFVLVSSIDLGSGKSEQEVYLMNSNLAVYASEENLYLTYQKHLSEHYLFEKFVSEVLERVLPSSEFEKVLEIVDSAESYSEKGKKIGSVLDDYMSSLSTRELFDFNSELEKHLSGYSEEIREEREKTVIHRIEIEDGDIDYEESGEVRGVVLNQFSMDEFEGYFRIATTSGGWNRDKNLNHLYVLDDDLDVVGEVENLSEGERIYSARFLGEKAYLVTFRQVDPLFAIDLSDPEHPEVIGELKITGYSGYLHPYDENHLIGIGMEATEAGRVQGVKVSLFDVSNFGDPEEVDSYVVAEGTWSSSEVVHDHKAVLFDQERNILVIPVSYTVEVEESLHEGGRVYPWHRQWQGAFVFDVSLSGIELRGEVTHQDGEESYDGNVRRSLYIDEVLYTISDLKIKANDLKTLVGISEVEFGEREQFYPYYGDDVAVSEPAIAVQSERSLHVEKVAVNDKG